MKKTFVLDTNVLLHDPAALTKFQEHDVYIPFVTLEELDGKKTGTGDINRNARQAIRQLDDLTAKTKILAKGSPLHQLAEGASGRLYLQQEVVVPVAGMAKVNDNQYLAVLAHLVAELPSRRVILVSKDLNLRVKARSQGFQVEDYRSDSVHKDEDLVPKGFSPLPAGAFAQVKSSGSINGQVFHTVPDGLPHGTVYVDEREQGWRATEGENPGETRLIHLTDFYKQPVWGIHPLNSEQNIALNLLLDPNIDFVTLLGPAGTGKTLLTLAAALELTFELKLYQEILVTRATVPLGDEIGFLPGTEEEKMTPWMGAITDNLEVLMGESDASSRGQDSTWAKGVSKDLISQKLKIRAMTFMRGRSFNNKIVIVDEAQNLTARQMKALVTRAGDNTKVICLGNLSQIDNAYLSEGSSGLTYAVTRFKGWPYFGHLVLEKGERSRLSSYANEVL